MLMKHGLAGLAHKVEAGGGGVTASYINRGTIVLTSQTSVVDLSSAATNDQLYIIAYKLRSTQTTAITALSLEGSAATLVGETSSTISRSKAYVYKIACPAAAAGNASAGFTVTAGAANYLVAVWKVTGTVGTETVSTNQYTSTTSPMTANVNTVTGGCVLTGGAYENATAGNNYTITGATENFDDSVVLGDQDGVFGASADVVTGETPRTIEASHGLTGHGAIISVALS